MKLSIGSFKIKRKLFAILLVTYLLSLAISRVHAIALAITLVVSALSFFAGKHMEDKRSWQLFEVLPELIDQIISGVQSGLSLNQSLISLEKRGPKITEPIFLKYRETTFSGANFENSISQLQADFSLAAADQLFEALVFAKNLGGSELLALLRQLGDFTRQDLALRREISAKQGWIKNSAHLSAGAPWLLLLLISAQPATAESFKTSAGALVLGFGALLTVTAYIWMGRLSRLPEPARIFGSAHGR
jgi:tight adherence protein B